MPARSGSIRARRRMMTAAWFTSPRPSRPPSPSSSSGCVRSSAASAASSVGLPARRGRPPRSSDRAAALRRRGPSPGLPPRVAHRVPPRGLLGDAPARFPPDRGAEPRERRHAREGRQPQDAIGLRPLPHRGPRGSPGGGGAHRGAEREPRQRGSFAPKHSGINCRTKQPIRPETIRNKRTQDSESRRLEVETRGPSPAGMGCKTSRRSRSNAGLPIRRPNCS
jgi:hypothetical protein